MSIISVKNLSKSFYRTKQKKGIFGTLSSLFFPEYLTKTALNAISFQIDEGELVGYIGPNGAGKSTTVKILSSILVPNSGEVEVMGKIPWQNRLEVVKNLGVVFGQRTQLWWDLPVIESFTLLKAIYQISDSAYQNSLEELSALLDLQHLYPVPVRQLSLGQRMRCDIAASLLHRPRILFLDEPTIGLDATSKLAVRACLRKINQELKTTILLTTHDMDDIESLCRRVIVLNQGEIFLDGPLEKLRKKIAPERRLIIDLMHPTETIRDPQAYCVKQEGARVWLQFDPEIVSTPKLLSRITSHHEIRDLYIENIPIEEVIATLYRDSSL